MAQLAEALLKLIGLTTEKPPANGTAPISGDGPAKPSDAEGCRAPLSGGRRPRTVQWGVGNRVHEFVDDPLRGRFNHHGLCRELRDVERRRCCRRPDAFIHGWEPLYLDELLAD